jgi:hypothetical protein
MSKRALCIDLDFCDFANTSCNDLVESIKCFQLSSHFSTQHFLLIQLNSNLICSDAHNRAEERMKKNTLHNNDR